MKQINFISESNELNCNPFNPANCQQKTATMKDLSIFGRQLRKMDIKVKLQSRVVIDTWGTQLLGHYSQLGESAIRNQQPPPFRGAHEPHAAAASRFIHSAGLHLRQLECAWIPATEVICFRASFELTNFCGIFSAKAKSKHIFFLNLSLVPAHPAFRWFVLSNTI